MSNVLDFLKKVNQNLVSELDILNFIDEVTKNDLSKLEQLNKDLETFEVKFISSEVVESLLGGNNPKSISESYDWFKKIVSNKIEKFSTVPPVVPPVVPAPENKHPNMFVNDSFKLFEYILNTHITENRGRINDISFYYWKMYNDNYIIQKPYPFVEWFTKLYDVENFQMKTLNTTQNPNRLKHYSNSLDWFKLKNQ